MQASWIVVLFVACSPIGCKRDRDSPGDDGANATMAAATDSPATSIESPTSSGMIASTSGDASGDPPDPDSTGAPPPPAVCGTDSAEALAACVDADPIAEDLAFIADIRTPGSTHWLAVQELCADRLEQLGYDVELHAYATGTNVIGRRLGMSAPQDVVLIGAHYDHIPNCLGADDNASGVAGALEAARVLADATLERTIAIACWDQEELGLIGSEAWVADGILPDETVRVYFNYDMIGFRSHDPGSQSIPPGLDVVFPREAAQVQANENRGDFVVVVADDLAAMPAADYEARAAALGLPTVVLVLEAAYKNSPLFADLRRSDHASFWAQDIPAIFLSDTGEFRNAAYHCVSGEDSVEALDAPFIGQVVAATVAAAVDSLGLAP